MQRTHKREEMLLSFLASHWLRFVQHSITAPQNVFKLRLHPADIPSGKLRISSAFQTGIPLSVCLNVPPSQTKSTLFLPNALLWAYKPHPSVRLVVSCSKRMKWIAEHHSDSCPWVPCCQPLWEGVTLWLHSKLLLQTDLTVANGNIWHWANVTSRHPCSLCMHMTVIVLINISAPGWSCNVKEADPREWHHVCSCC